MIKSLFAIALLGMLMSFAPKTKKEKPYFKRIDITFVSPQGCTFHVVGEATINVWKLKLTGFTGTITLGGPAGCPHGTYTINYASLNYDDVNAGTIPTGDEIQVQFDTDNLCSISSVKFVSDSPARDTQNACEKINNTKEKVSLIEAIKEGDCR